MVIALVRRKMAKPITVPFLNHSNLAKIYMVKLSTGAEISRKLNTGIIYITYEAIAAIMHFRAEQVQPSESCDIPKLCPIS